MAALGYMSLILAITKIIMLIIIVFNILALNYPSIITMDVLPPINYQTFPQNNETSFSHSDGLFIL